MLVIRIPAIFIPHLSYARARAEALFCCRGNDSSALHSAAKPLAWQRIKMTATGRQLFSAALAFALAHPAWIAVGQSAPPPTSQAAPPSQARSGPTTSPLLTNLGLSNSDPPSAAANLQQLSSFNESEIKFSFASLMRILQDSKHEGWVLAAYPDPKTSRPLIGAGFSLDVAATPHAQRDPLNPHSFIEPSAAELWQAAGLDEDRLQQILDQYERNLKTWQKKNYRRKIKKHTLTPQITNEEATQLLRISAEQAVVNARAYCRHFDQLNGWQQMALSQLVYQMGVNLEEFEQFLGAINDDASVGLQSDDGAVANAEHWRAVQTTLMESQWAKRYSIRAAAVIAMFDPAYAEDPGAAEKQVLVTIHPRPTPHHKRHAPQTVRTAHKSAHTHKTRSKA
jgi:hypothetical protein